MGTLAMTIISRPRVGEGKPLWRSGCNSGRDLTRRGIFFIFFGCNPLKSPDSEKLMKANESNFPFICFHLLAFMRL